jgi:hypothetical protein
VLAAHDEFADDEQRPAFVQQLHGFGDGTELVVLGAHLLKGSA